MLETCDICGKKFKRINVHKRWSHRKEDEIVSTSPGQNLGGLDPKGTTRDIEKVARILYNDVVKVLCEEYGIKIDDWEVMEVLDKENYLKIAETIVKSLEGESNA